MGRSGQAKERSETVHRFLISGCEIRMSVEFFGTTAKNLHFRDQLTDRAFCLSPSGEANQNCLERFSGSIAIAYYHFRPRLHSPIPPFVRERVLTIDHDSRMDPRPPFERVLPVERNMVSDIQAFGFNPDDSGRSKLPSPSLWCLLRQDLYMGHQTTASLIVHWKHSAESIKLIDVIPGEEAQVL